MSGTAEPMPSAGPSSAKGAKAATSRSPDVTSYVEAVKTYVDAGFDEIYLSQIGPDQDGFFRFWDAELKDALSEL